MHHALVLAFIRFRHRDVHPPSELRRQILVVALFVYLNVEFVLDVGRPE